jgi:hypothetical protein
MPVSVSRSAALDLLAIAPGWLEPRYPLVHALIHELYRLERQRAISGLRRPPRVSRTHRRSARKGS